MEQSHETLLNPLVQSSYFFFRGKNQPHAGNLYTGQRSYFLVEKVWSP
jgi:hypothetical protein